MKIIDRFDQERDELINLIISICDYAKLGYTLVTYNSCNNCKVHNCKYEPKWGEPIRCNCPLWKGEDDAVDAM